MANACSKSNRRLSTTRKGEVAELPEDTIKAVDDFVAATAIGEKARGTVVHVLAGSIHRPLTDEGRETQLCS